MKGIILVAILLIAAVGAGWACSAQNPPPEELIGTWAGPVWLRVTLHADCTYTIGLKTEGVLSHTEGTWAYSVIGGLPFFSLAFDQTVHEVMWSTDRRQLCFLMAHSLFPRSSACITWWTKEAQSVPAQPMAAADAWDLYEPLAETWDTVIFAIAYAIEDIVDAKTAAAIGGLARTYASAVAEEDGLPADHVEIVDFSMELLEDILSGEG